MPVLTRIRLKLGIPLSSTVHRYLMKLWTKAHRKELSRGCSEMDGWHNKG
jgi:hypothetical protein